MSDLEKELKRLRDERQKKFSEENWEGALEIHDQILALSPSALRYANRGSILYRLERLEDAIESYHKALEMEPSLKRARADLERLEAQLQKQRAQQATVDPTTPEPATDEEENKQDKSRKDYISEIRAKRQEAMSEGNWHEALQLHNKLIELDPTAMRYASQGSMLYRIGQLEEAIASYQKALELDPSLEKAKMDLKRLETQWKKENKVSSDIKNPAVSEVKNNSEKIKELREKRQQHIDAKEWDEALALHDRIIEMEPTALRYVNRGSMLYRMKRLEDAISSYQKAIEMDPNLGRAKMDLERMEKELAEKRKDVEKDLSPLRNQDPAAQEKISINSESISQDQQSPNTEQPVQKDKSKEVGQPAQAIEIKSAPDTNDTQLPSITKTKLTNTKPENIEQEIENLRRQRQIMLENDKWEEALELHNRIIELAPTAPRYVTRGSMLYSLGHADEAILSYRKAIELDPTLARAQDDLKKLQDTEMDRLRHERHANMQQENWLAALEKHNIIIALEPTALRYANQGSILYRLDRLQDAVVAYQTALEIDPELSKAKEDLRQLQEELSEIKKRPSSSQKEVKSNASNSVSSEFEETEEDDGFQIEEIENPEIDVIDTSPLEEQEEIRSETKQITPATFSGHQSEITSVLVTSEEKFLISASKDKTIRIWDIEKKKCIHILSDHTDWVRSIAMSPKQTKLISASDDWTIKIWDMQSGRCDSTLKGHTMPVTSVAVTGRYIFSGGRDRYIKIWDAQKGKCKKNIVDHKDWISCFALTSKGDKLISGAFDGMICILNVASLASEKKFKAHQNRIHKLLPALDGSRFISVAQDRNICVWEIESGTLLHTFDEHSDEVQDIAISPDGSLLASAGRDQSVRIWSLEDYSLQHHFVGELDQFYKISFSNDGRFVFAASDSGSIWIWKLEKEEKVAEWHHTYSRQISYMYACKHQSCLLTSSGDGKINVWDYSIL